MYCINVNHPEYLSLLATTGEHPHVLRYKIRTWMKINGDERFPLKKELEIIPIKETKFYNTNPIYQLGLKYVANIAGFMPVNVDLAQVQRDARKLDLTVHRAVNGKWYFRNSKKQKINPHKYRQIDSQSSILPYKDLSEKLDLWAKSHGISVTTMEELKNTVAETGSLEGSVAVADLFNRIIALDPEKERADTYAEEVAHFATAILKDDVSVKKAMEKIVDTEIYKDVKEAYASVYNTEEQFRKEAVDKLLAQSIVQEFKRTDKNKGIIAYIQAIFTKIKKWLSKFKKSTAAEEIKRDLYPLAQSVLRNEYLGDINITESDTVYHQKELIYSEEAEEKVLKQITDSKEKVKAVFAIKTANLLNNRLETLRSSASTEKITQSLQKEIDSLVESISNQEFTASVMQTIQYAEQELISVEKTLDKHLENNTTDGDQLYMIQNFIDMYKTLFKGFRSDMIRMRFSKKERDETKSSLDKIFGKLNYLEDKNDVLSDVHAIKKMNEENIDSEGNKIDEDFDGEEIRKRTKVDSSWWRFLVGNYKFADSGIIRMAHKIIFNANSKVKRFATERGNTLLSAQMLLEKSGAKVEDLIAKDSNGKYTQYLIRREDWAGYYKARSNMRSQLVKDLGFKEFSEIDINTLSKEDLVTYKEAVKKFNKEHSRTTYDPDTARFSGRVPKALNPRYAELMQNPDVRNYYQLLLNARQEDLAKLPLAYRTTSAQYLLPSVRSQFLEKMTDDNQTFLHNVKEITRESFFIDEDDTEFGEVTALNNKIVPIYFTQKFDNPANVSRDLTRSYTIFSEMAENFATMSKVAPDMEIIMSRLAKRQYKKGKNTVEGLNTKDYKVLETLVQAGVYGAEKKDVSVTIPDNAVTKKLHLADKKISLTKIANNISRYISLNNLALNPYTSTAGYLKGSVDSILEDQIGLYTTVESKNWARGEYGKNLTEVLSQVASKKQTNKMHLLLQRNNVVELSKMLRNTNKNKLLSDVTSRDLLFLNYRTADYAIKGRVALAIYDNTRLVGEKFMTRKNFLELRAEEGVTEKAAREEWKTYREKSLYNAYEVIDNVLQVKPEFKKYVTDAVENHTVGKITHIANTVDGTMSDSDKGAIARGVFGSFLLMHRGWFINMIDSRFMGEKTVMTTGESEMGIYPAMGRFIKEDIFKGGARTPGAVYTAYKNADPVTKRGVKKTLLDLLYLQIVSLLAAIANVAADDDDEDPMIQIVAYQLNRVLLEQSAGQPIFNYSELLQIIENPVVGVRTVKDLLDIGEAFNLKPYKSGMYKDHSHATKWWTRKIPGFKNIYESQFAESKNNFLKNKIIKSSIYDFLKEKDADEEFGIMDRLSLIFKDQGVSSGEEAVQIIEALEGGEI